MKLRDTVADLAAQLDLPEEAVSGKAKVTLIGRRQAVVEHHTGLLGYSTESVEVAVRHDRLRILGRELELRAMDPDALLITGTISAVEYG